MKKFRLHWTLHPEKDLLWYENEIKTKMMTEDAVARELDINYSKSISGRIFTPFKEERHVNKKQMTYNKHRPIYRIWDFGGTNATIYGQIDTLGRKTILHERVLTSSTTPEQIDAALSDSKELFEACEFRDICDPAGSHDDGRGASTHVELLNAEGINPDYRYIASLPTRERKKRGRDLILTDLQKTPGGKEAFMLYCGEDNESGCPTIKKAMQGAYAYKRDVAGNATDTVRENHPYEDVIDCLIYFYLEAGATGYDDASDWLTEPSAKEVNVYTGI